MWLPRALKTYGVLRTWQAQRGFQVKGKWDNLSSNIKILDSWASSIRAYISFGRRRDKISWTRVDHARSREDHGSNYRLSQLDAASSTKFRAKCRHPEASGQSEWQIPSQQLAIIIIIWALASEDELLFPSRGDDPTPSTTSTADWTLSPSDGISGSGTILAQGPLLSEV